MHPSRRRSSRSSSFSPWTSELWPALLAPSIPLACNSLQAGVQAGIASRHSDHGLRMTAMHPPQSAWVAPFEPPCCWHGRSAPSWLQAGIASSQAVCEHAPSIRLDVDGWPASTAAVTYHARQHGRAQVFIAQLQPVPVRSVLVLPVNRAVCLGKETAAYSILEAFLGMA